MKQQISVLVLLFTSLFGFSQEKRNSVDSAQKKQVKIYPKISHAEPLYVDLMRDLGARKGEAEVNFGLGVAAHKNFNEYNGFVEYEWAVANRLGMEVEVPFSFTRRSADIPGEIPGNKISGIKLATQYTFLVDVRSQTSMAIGYLHEFELNYFNRLGNHESFFTGMEMNPIFIAAKKIKQLNLLLYTGPVFENSFEDHDFNVMGTVNTSFLYVLPNQRHFIGIENNMDFDKDEFHYVLRPQIKIAFQHNFAIGFVTGIPVSRHEGVGMEFTTRIIWEPARKKGLP